MTTCCLLLHRQPRGVTLIELLVVVVLLGLMAGMSGLVIAIASPPSAGVTRDQRVSAARRDALRTGRSVAITLEDSAGMSYLLALPDGSVLADSVLRIERLTGRPHHVAR